MLEKISDKVYCLPFEKPTDRPNLFYINGSEKSLVIDAGNSANHVNLLYDELKKKNLRLPDYTVITHYHWDHTYGIHAVHGITIASVKTNNILKEHAKRIWTPEEADKMEWQGVNHFKNEYSDLSEVKVVLADKEFEGQITINLGDIDCIIEEGPSPHTDDSVFIHIVQEKLLAIGDSWCVEKDKSNWEEKTKKLINYFESKDFEYYLPGHCKLLTKEEGINRLKNEL